jgi:endonuclease/exonuclease/phosphatase family metal-dependent hydrolase
MTALSFLFFLETARELLGATYNMNLATMSINGSVISIFAFFSPVLYFFGISRMNTRTLVLVSSILLVASRVCMAFNPGATVYLFCTVVAVVSFGIFLPAYIFKHTNALTFVCAATIGAGADVVFRALGDTFDITVYGIAGQPVPALAIVVVLSVCFLIALFFWYTTAQTETKKKNQPVRALYGVGIGAVGFLYIAFLGYPNNVAQWIGGSYLLAAGVIGAALGGFGLAVNSRAQEWLTSSTGFYTANGALLVAFIVLVVSNSVLGIVLCGIAVFFLPVLFINTVKYLYSATIKQIAAFLAVAGLTLLILVLLFAFSLTYAYIPGMDILRNQAGTIIMVTVFVALFGVIAVRYKSSPPGRVHTRLVTILSIAVICSTWVGAGVYQAAPTLNPADSLTVMTYNIHQGYNTDGRINPWQILDPIEAVAPDILALQESDMNRITSTSADIVQWLAHTLDMYTYFGPETKNHIYGVAILSKFPLSNTETYYLTSIDDQRVLVRADIQWNNQPVSIYAVHMGLSEKDRTTQTAEVLEILAKNPNPKILMGDLNSVPGSEQMDAFFTVFADAWTSSGYAPTDPLGYTSDSLEPQKHIDYILVSCEFSVKTCEVIRNAYGSDHLPVWAEVVSSNGR